MNIESLISDTPSILIFILISIALAAFFHWRSGSSFNFFHRVYTIFIGEKKFHSDEISELWKEASDVERFNIIFNKRAASSTEIITSQVRISRLKMDFFTFSRIRFRFNMKNRKIKKPSWWQLLLIPLIIFFLFSFLLSYEISTSNSALIKFKEEGGWFWMNRNNAKSLFSPEWTLNEKKCLSLEYYPDTLENQTELKEKNIKIICDYFSKESEDPFIEDSIREQKKFAISAIWALLLLIETYLESSAVLKANYFVRKLIYSRKKHSDPKQNKIKGNFRSLRKPYEYFHRKINKRLY